MLFRVWTGVAVFQVFRVPETATVLLRYLYLNLVLVRILENIFLARHFVESYSRGRLYRFYFLWCIVFSIIVSIFLYISLEFSIPLSKLCAMY